MDLARAAALCGALLLATVGPARGAGLGIDFIDAATYEKSVLSCINDVPWYRYHASYSMVL